MVVFVLERVPTALRGELTRWLLELKPGVFLGTVSADVRERLWQRIIERTNKGAAYLAHAASGEQRFAVRAHGPTSRWIVDFDGLQLLRIPGTGTADQASTSDVMTGPDTG